MIFKLFCQRNTFNLSLIALKIQFLIFSPYIISTTNFPICNTFLFNYKKYGRLLADFLLADGIKKPILYGCPEAIFEEVRNVFETCGLRIPPENLLEEEKDFPDSALENLAGGKADSIVAKGAFLRYNSVMNKLKRHKNTQKIPLYLDYDSITKGYKKENPELEIRFMDKITTEEKMLKCGENAADKILELTGTPEKIFENIYYF